eukprot:CAMPEP_0114559244 /NCGR_PEP_ID=MMETSP0114-20121206/10818_1 /TAXON_ID=31324 /ORGANISM="Goniomonas sp, Strain m" /LENGTH=184 /DNA_ID=CAMNT_0001744701 /DNA_START=30 /DNA_END=584 /DNA_ORIENTATION=+
MAAAHGEVLIDFTELPREDDTHSSTSSHGKTVRPRAVAQSRHQARLYEDSKSVYSTGSTLPPPERHFLEYYSVNGGLDSKFDTELPHWLRGVLSAKEFEDFMERANATLRKYRHTSADVALLGMGAAMLPLIPFMVRHAKKTRKVRTAMQNLCKEYNSLYGERGYILKFDRVKMLPYITRGVVE